MERPMNRPLVVSTFGGLVLVMWLAAWSVVGSAERAPELLTGELWRTMSPDAKVAFVGGIGNFFEFERAQTGAQPAGGKPINEVVRRVDAYYDAHPDQIKRPVADALWQDIKKSLP